jgi:hypothetical protein
MNNKINTLSGIVIAMVLLLLSACGMNTALGIQQATPTPTPTVPVVDEPPPTETIPSMCEGLMGELEVQILVGPADAVGLSSHTVGDIPFAVTSVDKPYLIQGGGYFNYADILVEEWGTYEVTMNINGFVSGECQADISTGTIDLIFEMTGSQLVEVTADGFHQEYPWEGTHTMEFVLPLEEGASVEGEGYAIVLHLSQ